MSIIQYKKKRNIKISKEPEGKIKKEKSPSIKKLISLRPTEPMLQKVLALIEKEPYEKILLHFDSAQEKINKGVLKIINNRDKIFTHCHSTNVVNSLIYAKKKKKKFLMN